MSVYHGQCRGYHNTTAEARSCAGVGYGGETKSYRPAQSYVGGNRQMPSNRVGTLSGDQATFNQEDYVRVLYAERDVPERVMDAIPELRERLFDIAGNPTAADISRNPDLADARKFVSKRDASALIDFLQSGACTRKPKPAAASEPKAQEVPEGKYALAGDDGIVRFYKVDRPAKGRWAGYVFVNGLIGAPGSFNEVKLGRSTQRDILSALAKAPEEAARLFGRKFKICGYCSSPLSLLRSRASGYGETCAHNHGYWYASQKEAEAMLAEGIISE
jgi:hypothetical protein